MPRNRDLPLIPERSDDPCDVRTEAKCQMFNERKCSTSDRRECDKAYAVTAISDQNKFRKKVRTNLQPFITFGQQRTAVLEDDERKDVFVSAKIFFLGGVIVFLHVIDVVKISTGSSVSSLSVSSYSSNVESSKLSLRESSRSRKSKCKAW